MLPVSPRTTRAQITATLSLGLEEATLADFSSDPFAIMYFMGFHSREIVYNRGYVTHGNSADKGLFRVMANEIVVKAFTPPYTTRE
jgi:hypothetical protein